MEETDCFSRAKDRRKMKITHFLTEGVVGIANWMNGINKQVIGGAISVSPYAGYDEQFIYDCHLQSIYKSLIHLKYPTSKYQSRFELIF